MLSTYFSVSSTRYIVELDGVQAFVVMNAGELRNGIGGEGEGHEDAYSADNLCTWSVRSRSCRSAVDNKENVPDHIHGKAISPPLVPGSELSVAPCEMLWVGYDILRKRQGGMLV